MRGGGKRVGRKEKKKIRANETVISSVEDGGEGVGKVEVWKEKRTRGTNG